MSETSRDVLPRKALGAQSLVPTAPRRLAGPEETQVIELLSPWVSAPRPWGALQTAQRRKRAGKTQGAESGASLRLSLSEGLARARCKVVSLKSASRRG